MNANSILRDNKKRDKMQEKRFSVGWDSNVPVSQEPAEPKLATEPVSINGASEELETSIQEK